MGEQHKPSPFRLDSVGYDFFSLILINLFLISMPETLIWGWRAYNDFVRSVGQENLNIKQAEQIPT